MPVSCRVVQLSIKCVSNLFQLILGNSTHLDKSEEYRFFKPWLGEGLLISSGWCLVIG
jgi:hypothetical protein